MFLGIFQTAPAPAGFDFPLVTALVAFLALPVKVLVDVVKGAVPVLPPGLLPLVGLILGFGASVVVLIASRTHFDGSVYAQCAIAAVGAQIAAMAATSLQTKVQKVDERIDAALGMDSTKTRADVDAKVKADAAKG